MINFRQSSNYYFGALNAWTTASIVLPKTKRWLAYIHAMPRKPVELPPKVAKAFLADMHAFFTEKNKVKADGIAARQLHAIRQHYAGKLRLPFYAVALPLDHTS
jgi:hypothetical protein